MKRLGSLKDPVSKFAHHGGAGRDFASIRSEDLTIAKQKLVELIRGLVNVA
jgi:hypothetical protein